MHKPLTSSIFSFSLLCLPAFFPLSFPLTPSCHPPACPWPTTKWPPSKQNHSAPCRSHLGLVFLKKKNLVDGASLEGRRDRWNESYFSQRLWWDHLSLFVGYLAQLTSNHSWSIGECGLRCWRDNSRWYVQKSQNEIIHNSCLTFFICSDSDSYLAGRLASGRHDPDSSQAGAIILVNKFDRFTHEPRRYYKPQSAVSIYCTSGRWYLDILAGRITSFLPFLTSNP